MIKTRYSDIGSYTCEIVQQCRNGLFQTVFTVASIVSLEAFAPDIKKNPQDCQLKPGDFVEMRCIIEGYPIPDLQWYKDDQPLANKTMPILKVYNRTGVVLYMVHHKSYEKLNFQLCSLVS